jgi:hypothetical protein
MLPSPLHCQLLRILGVIVIGSHLAPHDAAAEIDRVSQPVLAQDRDAICSAWQATEATFRLAAALTAVADEGIRAAQALLTACQARPMCRGSQDYDFVKASLADARHQHARATVLAALMQERQEQLQQQLNQVLPNARAPGHSAPRLVCSPGSPEGSPLVETSP